MRSRRSRSRKLSSKSCASDRRIPCIGSLVEGSSVGASKDVESGEASALLSARPGCLEACPPLGSGLIEDHPLNFRL